MDAKKNLYNIKKLENNLRNNNIFIDNLPTQVHFLMIDKCNAKCIMCGGNYFHSNSKRKITLDKFIKMASNLQLQLCRGIVLAGAGDPLLNRDIIPIIQFVREQYPHISISVTTNGIALTDKLSKQFLDNDIGTVNISINSSTRETYRRIMQVDCFDKVCKNVKNLVDMKNLLGKKTRVQFSSAINRLNIEELPLLVELSRDLGVDSINTMYCRFYPEKIRHWNVVHEETRLHDKDSLFYHQELSDRVVEKTEVLAKKHCINFSHEPLFKENASPQPCIWPVMELMVGFDGEVYPCGGSEVHFKEKVEKGIYNFGNALTESIDSFWNNDFYQALRISSKKGGTCLTPECRCCANALSPNDIKAHIMEWDKAIFGEKKQTDIVQKEIEIKYSEDTPPQISVIVPTYNRPDMLAEALESILKQTFKNFEIVVVNDAGMSVEDVISKLNKEKNITYVSHAGNRGLAAARNTGITVARGKYIALLDDDDLFYPKHLETAMTYVSEKTPVIYTDAARATYEKHNDSYKLVSKKVPYSIDFERSKLLVGNISPVNCFVFEKEKALQAGLFDETLTTLEDWDFWIRLSERCNFKHIAKVTAQVNWRTDGTTMTSSLGADFQKNRGRIYKRYEEQINQISDIKSILNEFGKIWKEDNNPILPLVSIIVLTCNQLQYTKKCIESIFKYTKDPFELIVVDNGSTDGTVQYLENLKCRYGANCTDQQIETLKSKGRKKKKGKKKKAEKLIALNKTCADVKIIRNKENLGFAAGNNQGMAAAKGNYILLMNNDLVVTQGWLNRMISCAERSPKIGIVGPMSNYVSGPQLVKEVSYDTNTLARLNNFVKGFAKKNADQAKFIWRVVGFCMLIKRAVIDKIGGMDDRYGLGNFEDDDFSLRASLSGFESWIAEDCFVHHFGSRTFIGAKIDYKESLHKNWEIFKKKWGMPQELPYGSPYSISHIPNDGFDPAKHYCPLSKNAMFPEKSDIISESPGKIYGRIQPILASGQHEKAIIALEKLLESYPDFALAHNDLGVLYFNKREKEKALNHYEKAAQLEPNNITFQKNLSDFYYVELGRLEEALQGYVHVLSINPKDVETLLIVGHICVALHKFNDAQVFYSRVLEFEPENVDARQKLDKLGSGQLPVVSGQPEQDSVALKPVSFLMNQENDKENENTESQQEASNKNIRASIIIPALNQQKLIKKCIKSIQEYTSEPYEIIFINKDAKSSTLKWLRSVVKENVNYQLVELEKGADFARCYNVGIEASSGEYIVLLHGDVVVTEGWLSGLLECINSVTDAGIVGPMTNNTSGIQKVSAADKITINHLDDFAKSFKESNRYRRIHSRNLSELCLLFRRDLVEKIGFFDESLGRSNFETDDFCLKVALEGHRNLIAGDVFVYNCRTGDLIRNKKAFLGKWNGIDAQSPLGKTLLTLNAIENANELYQKDQIDDAVKMLVKGIGYDPDEKRLYYTLAEMLINNKQFKDALGSLNELPPDDKDVRKLELTGYCLEGMERYDEAEEYADQVLSINPASAFALNLKGVLAFRQGDNITAEVFFKRAIESDPGFGEPYTNLGALKWAAEKEHESLALYERGFILSPTIMDIATIYHSAVTDLGAFEKAEPVFRDAITLHPQNRRLKYLFIDILIKQDKHDLAMKEIEGAMIAFGIDDGLLSAALKVREALGPEEIDKKSKNKDAISLCMIVKNEEEHLAKCLRSVKPVVDEMIVVDTGSTDRTKDIARVFGARVFDIKWTDDFSEARNFSISKASGKWIFVMDADEVISPLDHDSLRKLAIKSTSTPVAYSFMTRNYSTRVNLIGFVTNDGKYHHEEAGTGWMPSVKVRLFHNNRRIRFEYPVHEKVEPSLRKTGIEVKRCNIPVHHYGKVKGEDITCKGEVYYQMGRKKLDETGDDIDAIRELAVQAEILGKQEEAIELWERLIALKPDTPIAYVNMATVYLKLDKYEDACKAAKCAVELAPHMKEALNNYALCELYLGNVKQTISVLNKILEQEPEYLSGQFLLAVAYCCDTRKGKGLIMFNKLQPTATAPGLAVACHTFAKKLVSAQRLEYAISLLEAAIEGKYVNEDVVTLLDKCRRTKDESMNHIDSASIFPIESKDAQPYLKNAFLH